MAIKVETNLESGVPVPDCYYRIENVRWGKVHDLKVTVVGYYNVDYKDCGRPVKTIDVEIPSIPSGDLLPGIYNYLKTLPEFANAVDC